MLRCARFIRTIVNLSLSFLARAVTHFRLLPPKECLDPERLQLPTMTSAALLPILCRPTCLRQCVVCQVFNTVLESVVKTRTLLTLSLLSKSSMLHLADARGSVTFMVLHVHLIYLRKAWNVSLVSPTLRSPSFRTTQSTPGHTTPTVQSRAAVLRETRD